MTLATGEGGGALGQGVSPPATPAYDPNQYGAVSGSAWNTQPGPWMTPGSGSTPATGADAGSGAGSGYASLMGNMDTLAKQPIQGVNGTPYGNPPNNIPGMPGFTQINDYYKSLIPVYQDQSNQALRGAMSTAGFGGTRYGSAAANSAADVGARYNNQMQSQINQMSQGQINSDLDRAMQQYISDNQLQAADQQGAAAQQSAYYNYILGQQGLEQKANEDALNYSLGSGQMGLDYYNADQSANQFAMQYPYQAALWQNQIFQGQVDPAMQFGQYEQGRQDQFSNLAYQDWNQNKYGMLPMLGGWAAGINAGSPGSVIPYQSSPGTPSQANTLGSLLGGLAGLFGGG
jgi:hypothetical protein